ncbi:MAG: flagellar biosynthetic protein FliO [Terracidiphilus sp.]
MKLETGGWKDNTEARGLAGWLLDKLRHNTRPRPRLALLERITLAPRQSLALIEADGRRLLVATSPEGAPAFFPLDSWADRIREKSSGAVKSATARQVRQQAQKRFRARTARATW